MFPLSGVPASTARWVPAFPVAFPPLPQGGLDTRIRNAPVHAEPHDIPYAAPISIRGGVWLRSFAQRGSCVHPHIPVAPLPARTQFSSLTRKRTNRRRGNLPRSLSLSEKLTESAGDDFYGLQDLVGSLTPVPDYILTVPPVVATTLDTCMKGSFVHHKSFHAI